MPTQKTPAFTLSPKSRPLAEASRVAIALVRAATRELQQTLVFDLNEALERIDTDRAGDTGEDERPAVPFSREYAVQAMLARQCALDAIARVLDIDNAIGALADELASGRV